MFWSYVIDVIAGFIAYGIMAFGGAQILISLFCTLPLTNRLAKASPKEIDGATIRKRAATTCIVWIIILSVITLAVIKFCPESIKIAAAIGAGLSLLFLLGKSGMSNSNIRDYAEAYRNYMSDGLYIELSGKPKEETNGYNS